MADANDGLTRTIREKVLAGELPKENCRMTWYGPGRGSVCAACGRPIGADEVEIECDLPAGGTIRFHQRCHEVWSTEWPSCDA